MKQLITFSIILLATIASAQTFHATFGQQGKLIVTDDATELPHNFDSLAIEFTAQGEGCEMWETGKMPPAHTYTLTPPPHFASGLSLRKTIWRGRWQGNNLDWQSQTSNCTALVLPSATASTDTIHLQPLVLTVPSATYTTDWISATAQGGTYTTNPTALYPTGAKVEAQITLDPAGNITDPNNLPPGLNYLVTVWDFQGMFFLENDTFFH